MPPDSRVHCGVAVFVQHSVPDGGITRHEVLMVKRAGSGEYASDGAGKWALPGGWMDFGEDFRDTATREVLEETGCTIEVEPKPCSVVTVMSEDGKFQIVVPIMQGRVIFGEPRVKEPDKHSEVRWVPFSEVRNLDGELFGSTDVYFRTLGLVP